MLPIFAHVDIQNRLRPDLVGAGQVNMEVVEGWDWFVWDFHPSISIGLALLIAVYLLVIGPLRRRHELGPPARRSEKFFFFGAIIILELSLDGPIHHLADNYLFSVHMFQHLCITLIAPLMLLAGIPGWAWDQVLRVPLLGKTFAWAVRPVPAFLIYNGVLVAFHLPDAYGATMVDHNIHIVEHLLFMGSAMLVWWPVLSRSAKMPPLGYGPQLVYLLAMSIPMKGLGATITVKQDTLYLFYAAAPRVWGLTPGGDQRLGGLMMWLPAGLVLWFLAARAFIKWWRADQKARRSTVAIMALFGATTLTACSGGASVPKPVTTPAAAGTIELLTAPRPYRVTLELPTPVDMSAMFVLKAKVLDSDGKIVPRARLHVAATMPEHGHGMMTEPKPAIGMTCDAEGYCDATDGVFRLDGYRLHMPGSWLFSLEVETAAGLGRAEKRFVF